MSVENSLGFRLTNSAIYPQCIAKLMGATTNRAKVLVMNEFCSWAVDNQYNESVGDTEDFKSASKSLSFRTLGNTAYTQQEWLKSIFAYSDSISHAPVNSPELALAFANRSAVLWELGKLEECIEDLQRALEGGRYPRNLTYKLLLREARCYRDLGQDIEANKSFDSAIEALQFSELPPDKKESWLTNLEEEKKTTRRSSGDRYSFFVPTTVPSLSYGSNYEVPCASRALGLRYNDKVGRHFVATRDIKIGDVLIVEDPYIVGAAFERVLPCCCHCQSPSLTLLPCPNCSWAMFCSEKCRCDAYNEYHQTECLASSRFILLMGTLVIGQSSQIIRCVSKVGLNEINKYFDINVPPLTSNEAKRTRGFNCFGKYDSKDFLTILNLYSNSSELSPIAVFHHTLLALQIAKCFNPTTYLTSPDLSALILTVMGNLGCTAFNIKYLQFSASRFNNFVDNNLGATFPTAALMNHSCNSNTVQTFYGKTTVLQAAYPIAKGKEVTVNYGPSFVSSEKLLRQNHLLKYWFVCECEACVNDWPTLDSLPSLSQSDKLRLSHTNVLARIKQFSHQEDFFIKEAAQSCFANRKSFVNYIENAINERSEITTILFNNKACINKQFMGISKELIYLYRCHGNLVLNMV